MTSPDLTDANIEKLAALFPSVVTESYDEDGNPKNAIDFDLLRQELSDHIVEGPQERYRLDWPGKRAAAFAANAPIAKTLRPVRDQSLDFDTTRNIFIEGDNLDALKLLQESYLGKIKVIFIDPPYNTGSDFLYEDDYAETVGEYLSKSGQSDLSGTRLVANLEANGRFHSDWLDMMYPRIKLARNLLSADGVLFVTIGDREVANLKRVGEEIFGEANFVANIVWQSRTSISGDLEISPNHNHVLVFSRDRASLTFWGEPIKADEYSNPDNDPRGPWKLVPLDANKPGGDTMYEVVNPDTGQGFWPPEGRSWAISSISMTELIADGRVKFGLKGTSAPKRKLFLNERIERDDTRTPSSILLDAGTTKTGTDEIVSLFEKKGIFDYPKPTTLIQRLVQYGSAGAKDAIVLDFFAGSGTTAHAVMKQNVADGGQRRFILVQLDEDVDSNSIAGKEGFCTIADLCVERLRRAGASVVNSAGMSSDQIGLDVGFRAFRIDTTNMADVLRVPDETDQQALSGLENGVKPDRTAEDLLFQVLLDWGLELSMPIMVEELDGHEVFVVEGGAVIACFDLDLGPELMHLIANRGPLRAVFRDAGFASDAARINAEQIFREVSPSTDVKAI